MTLESNWNIISDRENFQRNFKYNNDFKFKMCAPSPNLYDQGTMPALSQLSINQNESSLIKSKTNESNQSKVRHNIDSPTDMTATLKETMIKSAQNSSNNQCENMSYDQIHRLTESFQSCTLNDKTSKIGFK